MIIRKPYAFLIKNFKKIHVVLLLLSLYAAYRLFDTNRFMNEFMRTGSYDAYLDPITNHNTFILRISILLIIAGSAAIALLLRHKQKPWKIYLIPVMEYAVLFFVLNMIKGFFSNYSSDISPTDLRMFRDLLTILLIVQFPAIVVFIVRVFGLDLKKFQFNTDQEFLELSEADREEMEIGMSVDKNSFIRGYKRLIRNIQYFYMEHTLICRVVLIGLGTFILVQGFIFIFITNRTYSQGKNYSVDGYTFKVNEVYVTDKDYRGNVIEKNRKFIIVDMTIQNHQETRKIILEKFHIRNGKNDSVTTRKTYANEFQDFGDVYESVKELKQGETLNCIIVFKVDKNLKNRKFQLYYQEESGYLRKIKIKLEDLSQIEKTISYQLEDEFDLGLKTRNDVIRFDYAFVIDEVEYTIRSCNSMGCSVSHVPLEAKGDNRILYIEFGSEQYEAKQMLNFLKNYAHIHYQLEDDSEDDLEIVSAIPRTYTGKTVYLTVPKELENAKKMWLEFVIRNKSYRYQIYG